MSLINDALRRARDAARDRPPAAPQPPLAPVDHPTGPRPIARGLVLALVACAVLLSMVSFWKWAYHQPATTHAQSWPTPPSSQVAPAPDPAWPDSQPIAPAPPPAQPSPLPIDPIPAPAVALLDSPASSPDTEPDMAAALPEVADSSLEPEPIPPATEPVSSADSQPELRLQSIIYRLSNPAVLINGQMLHVGDSIADGTVTDIQRHAVTVQRGESNIVLQLPDI